MTKPKVVYEIIGSAPETYCSEHEGLCSQHHWTLSKEKAKKIKRKLIKDQYCWVSIVERELE